MPISKYHEKHRSLSKITEQLKSATPKTQVWSPFMTILMKVEDQNDGTLDLVNKVSRGRSKQEFIILWSHIKQA